MAKDFSTELRSTTSEFSKQDKFLSNMVKSAQALADSYGKISASAGQASGGNMMSNSLAKFSTGEKIGMGLAAVGGIGQAMFRGMPSTADVIQRATGYYNAGVMQGFGGQFTQSGMYNHLAAGLGKFGIQSPQATAQLAQYYGNRGISMGGAYEQNLTAAVGGATRYLNMDTNRAAVALENMTAGAGGQSANLLRSMGIFTANPYTGKVKSQQQLFDEIHQRLTVGRGQATTSEVQDSFRRGSLGYFLKNSGMSEDQQQLFYTSELYRSETGKSLDLSDQKALDAAQSMLEKKGFLNPQNQMNKIAASEEGVLQAAQGAYIEGLKLAVPIIEGLNTAAGQLAASFGQFKSMLDAINSTNAGSATTGLLGDLGSGGVMLLGGMGGGKGGKGGAKGNAKAKPGVGARVKAGIKAPGVRALGVAGTVINTVGAVMDVANGAPMGASVGNAIGSTVGMLAGGALGTLLDPILGPFGTILGGMAGSYLGGMAGSAIGGLFDHGSGGGANMAQGGPAGNPASTSASGNKDGSPKFVRPATGPITGKYGPRKAPIAGASTYHRGVDIGAASGSAIVASADGKVTFAGVLGTYGNHVKVQHANGYVTSYSHMSRIAVKVGDQVNAGNKVGTCGTTGLSTGPHLHFEVLKNGSNIDPATIVPGLGSAGVATVTNTLPASNSSAEATTTATEAATAGASAVEVNGSSGIGAMLNTSSPLNGYAQSDISSFVSVSGSNVKLIPLGTAGTVSPTTMSTSSTVTSGGQGGPANAGSGMITDTAFSSGKKNSVVINLSIQKASDSEAKRFASLVKDILEDDSNITKIGRA